MNCARRSAHVVVLLALLAPVGAWAEFYSWTDEKGVKHFSTVPRDCITPDGTVAPGCQPPPRVIFAEPKSEVPPPPPEKRAAKKYRPPEPEQVLSVVQYFAFGVIGYIAYFVLKALVSVARRRDTIYVKGPGGFNQEIVGESRYQGELKSICGGYSEDGHRKYVRAQLILEDDNEHDSKAVRVDIEGVTAGYLTREDARIYRRQIAKAGKSDIVIECDAVIVGGWKRGLFDTGYFGVKLDLPVDQV